MTIEWFESRPLEDWDFTELHDCMREALSERDEAREAAEVFRRSMYALEERACQRRAALEIYGRHHGHCGAAAYPCPSSCTCGLAEALEGAE